jgi:tetratricopeptide (TPR) repeat protein
MPSPDPTPEADRSDLDLAREHLAAGRLQPAESHFRAHLNASPADEEVTAKLSDLLLRLGRAHEAEKLLAGFLSRQADATAVRSRYTTVLLTNNKMPEVFAQLDELLRREPDNPSHRQKKADLHVWMGEYPEALAEYERLLVQEPAEPGPWLAYARTLRWMGRQADSIAAYKRAISRFPDFGEAWWSLASIKTFQFDAGELRQLSARADMVNLPLDSAAQIHFALAKALDDAKDYEGAFAQLRKGNGIVRAAIDYDANLNSAYVSVCRDLFTEKFFAERDGKGCADNAPIFIVGMPRSGSTLVEQILASHPNIEGTSELRSLIALADRVTRATQIPGRRTPYPDLLRTLDSGRLKAMGEEYLERTRPHRRLGRAHFLDKMPENFLHTGLIHLILPNAKIIDVRRHPIACCLSCYQHYFSAGKNFAFGLNDLGRYYRDYVALMAHFDSVLPGKVHRVIYERLVENPDGEIKRLLDFVGLEPDERCVRFYENERAVQTWSAEQVRMPLFKGGSEHWRKYETWLAALKKGLGPVLELYPDAPNLQFRPPPEEQERILAERQLWSELQLSRPTLPQVANWRR